MLYPLSYGGFYTCFKGYNPFSLLVYKFSWYTRFNTRLLAATITARTTPAGRRQRVTSHHLTWR